MQFNVARMRAPYEDPIWDKWRELLPVVHAQAAAAPGYIGRYAGEKDTRGYIAPYEDDPLVMGALTAWTTPQALRKFTLNGTHGRLLEHRERWFEPWAPKGQPYTVLWWQRAGGFSIEVAKDRLETLRRVGPTDTVFGLFDE